MSALKNLRIKYEDNRDVFFPGDFVSGRLIMEVEADRNHRELTNLKGIWVRFKGKAKIVWVSQETDYRRHDDSQIAGRQGANSQGYEYTGETSNIREVSHVAREKYFDTTIVLFGAGENEETVNDFNLPPGIHNFPFAFEVPQKTLPASFEGSNGYVRYKTEAVVSHFEEGNYKAERLFTMVGPTVDLNLVTDIQEPMEYEEVIKGLCGCGFETEAVESFRVPRRGYVPGEAIYVSGDMDNRDMKEHLEFGAVLVQKVVYKDNKVRKTDKIPLAEMTITVSCPRGRVSEFTVGPLSVPPLPASGLRSCSLIDVEYYVQCKGPSYDMKFPITIGNVPLRVQPPTPDIESTSSAAEDGYPLGRTSGYSLEPHANWDSPVPYYKEGAVQVKRLGARKSNNHISEEEEEDFLPRYPFFNFTEVVVTEDTLYL